MYNSYPMSETDFIPFASGLAAFDAVNHRLVTADRELELPSRQLAVMRVLAAHVGEVVFHDELIDHTQPGLTVQSDRYRQHLRLEQTIIRLRQNLDVLIPDLGSPWSDMGAIRNSYRRGYCLVDELGQRQR